MTIASPRSSRAGAGPSAAAAAGTYVCGNSPKFLFWGFLEEAVDFLVNEHLLASRRSPTVLQDSRLVFGFHDNSAPGVN